MRLNKLKLGGFKSFVDPTTLLFPSNITAIVGPNGCGKSNIIDSVRWVLGETSAKQLRSGAMADVIFNGSSARKPVGNAFVELVFDNSDGRISGNYAQYSEISVRREVDREGQSSYFLNQSRCRRRDITHLFLGTGLGPRSYAVIEQGMISRLIEAKPDELRAYLEEVAGISKYKERRRETELRIRHTRENLARLDDIRDELAKQLDRLEQQAKGAKRYTALKEELAQLQEDVTVLAWCDLAEQSAQCARKLDSEQRDFDKQQAMQQSNATEIEKQRVLLSQGQEALQDVQQRYYRLGADIARLEQTLAHQRERADGLNEDIKRNSDGFAEVKQALASNKERIAAMRDELVDKQAQLAGLEQVATQSSQNWSILQSQMQDWQGEWDAFQQQSAQRVKSAEVQKTTICHHEEAIQSASKQLDKFNAELSQCDIAQWQEALQCIENQYDMHHDACMQASSMFEQTKAQAGKQSEALLALEENLGKNRDQYQRLRGQYASLEALQVTALGKKASELIDWLAHYDLQSCARLAEIIKVDSPWELAVECVLGYYLQAICVEDLNRLFSNIHDLPQGNISFLEQQGQCITQVSDALTQHTSLLQHVQSPVAIAQWLQGIYCCADRQYALANHQGLAPHESLITPDGLWVGPTWLRVYTGIDQQTGVIARERELEETALQCDELEKVMADLSAKCSDARLTLQHLHEQSEAAHRQHSQLQRELAELAAKRSEERARITHKTQRASQIEKERIELNEDIGKRQQALQKTRLLMQEALDGMAQDQEQEQVLQSKRKQALQALDAAREQAQNDKANAHQIALDVKTLQIRTQAMHDKLSQLGQQSQMYEEQADKARQAYQHLQAPLAQTQEKLQEALEKRISEEKQLSVARDILSERSAVMSDLETKQAAFTNDIGRQRTLLEQTRLDAQSIHVRKMTIEEDSGHDSETFTARRKAMPDDARIDAWQIRIMEVEKKIQRLGAINLAAIDEFSVQSERKQHLDEQFHDLTEALEILLTSMATIDKQTRNQFKQTFNQINAHLGQLFPKIFAGGECYLQMTSDDLLETGVNIVARPPGKRNASISQLSGGEKALTAISLVFSLFQLNPSPFCMLDEVDAPLDDANVERYCQLLKEMTDNTQFIYITHNRISMELAHQLMGVTMKEAGVSRLVSVDLVQAAELVD